MIAPTIKTATKIPRHIPSLPLCVLAQTTRPGGDRPVLSPSSKGYHRIGINQLSPKRFKRFWREFRKFYNFCGDHNGVRSGERILGPGVASPRYAELRRPAERKFGLNFICNDGVTGSNPVCGTSFF